METKTELRIRAEAELKTRPRANEDLSESDMKELIHELQVYQIQLEMQNEELKTIQDELEDSRNKFEDLYNFAPVGYVTVDTNGIIIESNMSATTMLGITKQYMIGKKFNQFIHSDSQDEFYLHCKSLIDHPQSIQNCELKLKKTTVDNDSFAPFCVQLTCAILKLNGDYRIKISITDISQIKQLENEKAKAQIILEKQKRHVEIGELAGKISHDFNNILAIIMGNTELSLFSCEDEQLIKSLKIINEQAIRGKDLTKQLQTYSKDINYKQEQTIPMTSPIHTNKYILIVEDEEYISSIQREILTGKPFNHNVDIARDGHIALKLIRKNRYDFITLDYILPGKFNGMHIYEHIREIDSTVPVLFISGNIEFLESIKDLRQNDKNIDHLTKPHEINDYVSYVNRLIGLSFDKKELST